MIAKPNGFFVIYVFRYLLLIYNYLYLRNCCCFVLLVFTVANLHFFSAWNPYEKNIALRNHNSNCLLCYVFVKCQFARKRLSHSTNSKTCSHKSKVLSFYEYISNFNRQRNKFKTENKLLCNTCNAIYFDYTVQHGSEYDECKYILYVQRLTAHFYFSQQ